VNRAKKAKKVCAGAEKQSEGKYQEKFSRPGNIFAGAASYRQKAKLRRTVP